MKLHRVLFWHLRRLFAETFLHVSPVSEVTIPSCVTVTHSVPMTGEMIRLYRGPVFNWPCVMRVELCDPAVAAASSR